MPAIVFPLIAVVIWAGNNLVGKLSVDVISPAAIAFYRWLLAAILLTPFMLPSVWKLRHFVLRNLFKFSLLAILGVVAFQSLGYVAAASTSATHMGLIGATVPLLTLLISLIVLREAPTLGAMLGAALSFIGLAILLSGGHLSNLTRDGINQGDLLMLIGATAYALYGVLIRHWQIPMSVWQSLYVQILLGLLWLMPAVLMSPSMAISESALPLVLYAGIASSVVAPFCWMSGIQKLGASNNAIFMNLIPLFTTASAVAILGEKLHSGHLVGGLLIISGVMLSQWLRQPLRLFTRRPTA
ncbi:DMT family transporter [Ferrimonas gelatinilytica]|uniref:DMT family transporter n=1 Tax=Ferrimonas gelatinilytica TaxID=1255257 RepID=A0ABP9RYB8_9GAMM